jgi:serine/threonine-protein kinase
MADLERSSLGDFKLGDWLVQPSLNRISRGEEKITLELKVMHVLACLAEHTGDLVTRQELVDTVWATEFISDNTVTHAVTELRNALGDDAKNPTYIETIHRSGYRLILPVERVSGEGGENAVQAAAGKPRWPHILAVVVAAAIALFFVFPPEGLFERLAEQPAEATVPRIVVLPFENLGPPEDEYFADGMTEEITSRLSAVSALHVISRTSAMHYKGSGKAIRQIGEELNVQYALEGTVRWEPAGEGRGRVRITPQLIEVTSDRHLWSDRYDRAIESVFEVQSDIAGQVVEQLHVSLLKPEEDVLNARLTDSPEAYEAYLRGLHHSADNDNLDSVRLAVAMFERSVELDPDFAVAWANLSNQMSWLYFNWDRTPERREAARHAAKTAIEIEPSLPESHCAQGMYFYWCHRDYERALEALDRALTIRPNYTSALFNVAVIYRRQGHLHEAIELMQRAFLLDPKDAEIAEALSRTYQATRNFLQADRFIDLSISLAPDRATGYFMKSGIFLERGRPEEARQTLKSAPVRAPLQEWYFIEIDLADRRFEAALTRTLEFHADTYVELWGELGEAGHALDQCRCYHFLGDLQGVRTTCGLALDLLKKLVPQDPQIYPLYTAGFGEAYAYLGLKDEAIREAQRGVALLPVSRDALFGPLRVEHLALVYALVNEPDLAIDQLDYLLSIPGFLSVGALRNHPNWDPLRDHPRFQALLEEYEVD